MGSFTLKREVTETFQEGWGVSVTPIYNDNDAIVDIDVVVVRIAEDVAKLVGNVWCVPLGNEFYVPIENFADVNDILTDDTHDLRTRWFATELQAYAHVEGVIDEWHNPAPWQSFVRVD